MMCIGRHTARESLGKDLVIADPLSKKPVGLIPDFLHHQRTGQRVRGENICFMEISILMLHPTVRGSVVYRLTL